MREHLSASFIDDYLRCPYKAITSREEKTYTGNVFTELGSLVHKTLDKYYSTDATIFEVYEEELQKAASPDLQMYTTAQKMLQNFEAEEATSEAQIMAREVKFDLDLELEVKDTPHTMIKGVMDRIDYLGDGVFEIIDYKTSMFVKERWELENDLQMAIYDLAFWELWKSGTFFNPEVVDSPKRLLTTIYYLRHGKYRLPERTQEQRDSLKRYLIQMFQIVRNTEPIAKVNKYCPYCLYKNSCKAFDNAVNVSPDLFAIEDMTANEIAVYFEDLRTRETLIKKRLDEVKDKVGQLILAEDGPVETEEYLVSTSVKKYKKRDILDVRKILEPLELFNQVLEVSNKKLEKTIKENNLRDVIDRITTYSFSKPIISVKKKPATLL